MIFVEFPYKNLLSKTFQFFECPAPIQQAATIQQAVQNRAKHGIYGYTLIPPPYYDAVFNLFDNSVTDNRRQLITISLKCEENYYTMDFEAIEAATISKSIKMCVICNFHNPIGRVWKRAELFRLMGRDFKDCA